MDTFHVRVHCQKETDICVENRKDSSFDRIFDGDSGKKVSATSRPSSNQFISSILGDY